MIKYQGIDFKLIKTFGFVPIKKMLDLFIEKVTNFFKNGYGIRFKFRVLSQTYQFIEKLFDIG